MPKIQDYLARCGMIINRDVEGTPPTITIASGDVDTWIALDNSEITGGELSNGIENKFNCSTVAGEVEATFQTSRKCLFIGTAQVSASNNNVEFGFSLFRNEETDPIQGLRNSVTLTNLDNVQTITGDRIIDVSPGDKFYIKFRSDTATTITLKQFSIALVEA